MIKIVIYSSLILYIVSCNGVNKERTGLTGSINETEINIKESQNIDTNVRNIFINSLAEFRTKVIKKETIDDSFFEEILEERITPIVFVMWDIYDKETFEETVILIFLKMFNPDIAPWENNISMRSETNPYLLFLIHKYYEMSKKDPANIVLLSRVVEWIVYEYDTKGNVEIENMILNIKKMFNLEK